MFNQETIVEDPQICETDLEKVTGGQRQLCFPGDRGPYLPMPPLLPPSNPVVIPPRPPILPTFWE